MEKDKHLEKPQTAGKVSTDLLQRRTKLDETWQGAQDGLDGSLRSVGSRVDDSTTRCERQRLSHYTGSSASDRRTLVNSSDVAL